MEHVSLPVEVPLRLAATLRPLTGPWGRFDGEGWWRAVRTADGCATIHLRRPRQDTVEARVWGPAAPAVAGRLADWVGLHDPAEAFRPPEGPVAELHRRRRGMRFGSTAAVTEAAVLAVVGQKVTGKEAWRSLRALSRVFGDPAPGPVEGLWTSPDPERLAVAYHQLHPLGVERRRAETLLRVARAAARLDRLAAAPPGAARRVLERIPGVGEWTSAETVAVSHGDPDAVSVGDYHLKHLVVWHLTGRPRGSDEEMLQLLEPFRPHRGRVIRLLETLGWAPRFGPRMPLRSFAGF